jgi:putative glycosyl hydrolase-like family 15 (GHL15) protein
MRARGKEGVGVIRSLVGARARAHSYYRNWTTVLVAGVGIASMTIPTLASGHTVDLRHVRPAALLAGAPAVSPIPAFAPDFMASDKTRTLDQAVQQAQAFDYIVSVSVGTYKPYLTEMRAANPSVKVLIYVNGTFAFPSELPNIPAAWYARDAAGNAIQSLLFGNTLMDPTNADWIANRQQKCISLLAASHYDGCFVDTLGPAPTKDTYVSSLPYNPITQANWTLYDWLGATATIGAMVKAAITPALVFVNGLQHGKAYFDPVAPTSRILAGVDGGMFELFMRASNSDIGLYPTEARWLQDVSAIADMALNGKTALVLTKVWVPGTRSQYAAWDQFTKASFLMGYGGNAYLNFRTNTAPSAADPTWAVDLGAPLNGYYKNSAGYYERPFEKGLVMANLTTTTFSVALGANYLLPSGKIGKTVMLRPNRGLVLVRS